MNKQTIKDIDLANKPVLVRVDYNVAFGDQGEVLDDGGIINTRDTINYLLQQNCRVFLLSHLGRPKGQPNPEFSLKKIVSYLTQIFNQPVKFEADYLNQKRQTELKNLPPRTITLLENTRFYPGEKTNDPQFARQLAQLGEVFVNDGFGVCHRQHASVVGVAEFLPAVAGLLLAKEVDLVTELMSQPQRPFIAILGGVKIKTRLGPINRLVKLADKVLIGGALVKHLSHRQDLELPLDVVIGDQQTRELIGDCDWQQIPAKAEAFDIGPKTRQQFTKLISQAKTIIWNGPMGLVEVEVYTQGSEVVYQAIVNNLQATSLVGGGDTLAFLRGKKGVNQISHRSTGGGALLRFIEKQTLPGIEVLLDLK